MKKYVNKAGNVVIIEQEKDGFSPMYENYTFLNLLGRINFPLCKIASLNLSKNGSTLYRNTTFQN